MKIIKYLSITILCLLTVSVKSSELTDQISPESFNTTSFETSTVDIKKSQTNKKAGHPDVGNHGSLQEVAADTAEQA